MWTSEYAMETGTTPARIWHLWRDVSRWPAWNPGVARADLTGAFHEGSTIAMTLPDGEVVSLTLDAVENGVRFVDVACVDGLVIRTEHRIEPIGATRRHRVVYALTVTGDAPPNVLDEVGRAVSGDFADVIASLVRTADRLPAG